MKNARWALSAAGILIAAAMIAFPPSAAVSTAGYHMEAKGLMNGCVTNEDALASIWFSTDGSYLIAAYSVGGAGFTIENEASNGPPGHGVVGDIRCPGITPGLVTSASVQITCEIALGVVHVSASDGFVTIVFESDGPMPCVIFEGMVDFAWADPGCASEGDIEACAVAGVAAAIPVPEAGGAITGGASFSPSGEIMSCGWLKATGVNWVDTNCYFEVPNKKVKYNVIWWCPKECSDDWETSGKIYSNFGDSQERTTHWYISYLNGQPRGKDNDVNCREYKKRASYAVEFSGGISQNSACLSGLNYPKGGWDAGIELK